MLPIQGDLTGVGMGLECRRLVAEPAAFPVFCEAACVFLSLDLCCPLGETEAQRGKTSLVRSGRTSGQKGMSDMVHIACPPARTLLLTMW